MDFGAMLNGDARWLEIGVASNIRSNLQTASRRASF